MKVSEGEEVRRRQLLATVGQDPAKLFSAHLHLELRWDASLAPTYWPSSDGKDAAWLREHYEEPSALIKSHRKLHVPQTEGTLVLVDQQRYKAQLYTGGRAAGEYNISLGQGVGEKQVEGDNNQQYRELGAKTRAMLVAAAAARWSVAPGQCRTDASVVRGPAGQTLQYGELAADAARQPVPTKVKLKTPSEFKLIGKRVKRLDSRAKCDGSLKFGLDLDLPGMLVAVVARPPVWGAKVRRFDDQAARAVEGVREVFEIPVTRGGTGVAVVADKFWPAKRARDLLKIEWDDANVERADSTKLFEQYRQLARPPASSSPSTSSHTCRTRRWSP